MDDHGSAPGRGGMLNQPSLVADIPTLLPNAFLSARLKRLPGPRNASKTRLLTVCALGAGRNVHAGKPIRAGDGAATRAPNGESSRVVNRMFPVKSLVIGLRQWRCAALPDRDAISQSPRREPGPAHNGHSRHARPGSTPACSPLKTIVTSHPIFENTTGKIIELFVASLVLLAMSGTAMAAGIQGTWLTEDGDAALTIADCGGQLCGRIVWLESATDRSGSLRLDDNNPDPARQTQRICGLVVIRGLKPSGPDTWDGYVYNPQDGKTYSGDITVLSDKALKLRAYIGLPIFGRSEIWTRTDSAAADGMEHNCRSDE